MDVFEAETRLGKRDRRKVGNNTYLERRENGSIALKYHATDVLTFHPKRGRRPACVEYNTGGWYTVTTKVRLNEYGVSNIRVFSDRGTWYVAKSRPWRESWNEMTYDAWRRGEGAWTPFFDGILIDGEGNVLNPLPVSETEKREKARKLLRRRVTQYVSLAMRRFEAGMPAQDSGDCIFCQFRTVDGGVPLGDSVGDNEHLLSHIDEGYVMPSLFWNAVKAKGYLHPEIILGLQVSPDGKAIIGGVGSASFRTNDSVKRALRSYLNKRVITNAASV